MRGGGILKPCLVIPIHDHGDTIAAVVESLAKFDLPCIIVDDGSSEETRAELGLIEERHAWVTIERHARNLGKGAALKTAYRAALRRGFTHALQIDADGQHEAADVPRLLAAAADHPEALVLGEPIFDESAPWHRLHGRKLSKAAVWLLTLSTSVRDPLCGFRCIPLTATVALLDRVRTGDRMDFDPELTIRLVRGGLAVVHVPTAICHPKGGRSHFRMLEDNALIARCYLRLALELPWRSRRSADEAGPNTQWASARERGSKWALQLMVWVLKRLGDAPGRLLLRPIALYYCFFDRSASRASRDYLARVDRVSGRASIPTGLRGTYRHFLTFAELLQDRLQLWRGNFDDFEIVVHGEDDVAEYFGKECGVVLLGAHLGSFDLLRVLSRRAGISVNVLSHLANAQIINEIFEALDPDCNVRMIEVGATPVSAAFEARRCAERGECVAVLADRLPPVGRERVSYSQFLGEPAPFPQGPFRLPMVLGLPTVLTLALKTGPRRYEIFLELLGKGGAVPRRDIDRVLRERIDTFASRLEHYTLREPLQWFNFYDFWDTADRERS